MADERARPGKIITFYSYKGGTGRTMAVANTAWIMASNGFRVLVVDWDLESPGLHRYLHPLLVDKRLRYSTGLIDMIRAFADATMDSGADPHDGSWFDGYANVQAHAVAVEWPFPGEGRIDFVPAGQQVSTYSKTVSTFDWPSFYEKLGGEAFLTALQENMRREYDYVLIDSRTGLSDIAGICTVKMPDVVVNCFTMSTQSIDGAAAVAKSIRGSKRGSQIQIYPVPMKVEDGEQEKLEAGRDHARATFAQFLSELTAAEADAYWGNVEIPYKPFYAYEEILAPFGDRSRQENTLLAAFERLSGVLTDGRATELRPPFDEADRRRELAKFERRRRAMPAEVVISYASVDRMWAEWAAAELSDINLTAVLQEVDVASEDSSVQEIERRLARSSWALVLLSQDYIKSGNAPHIWKTITAADTVGGQTPLVPLRLDAVRLPAPFAEQVPIDLGNLSEARARDALFDALGQHPTAGSNEPGGVDGRRPRFPGTPPPFWHVPQRNAVFTGRIRALESLRDRLSGSVTAVVHQTLYGLGGVGKTQIALEYAHRFAANYDLVWWISAEQVSLVRSSLAELATALHLPAGDSVRERVEAVLEALRRGVPSSRWLLILDNADDPDELRDLLPQGTGHVLITSRNQAWARQVAAVEVGVFDPEESVSYLCRRVPGLSEADAALVAEYLGDLPLAVEQAAAWLSATAMPVDRYLKLLRTQLTDVLEENLPPGYPRSATATWLLSLQQLRVDTPAVARLLELCAVLGPEPIPTWLLSSQRFVEQLLPLDARLRDPLRHGRLIHEVGRYALASIDSGRSSIQMHRLVQQVIRDKMGPERLAANRNTVHTILAAANPGDTDDPSKWPIYGGLRPHIGPSEAITSPEPEVRQLVSDLVRYLWKISDFAGCRELAELAEEAWRERFGPDDPITLMIRCNLGNSLRSEARYDQAFEVDQEVVERLNRILGKDDEYALVAAGGLASDHRAKGDYPAARALDEQTYSRWQRVFGEEHPRTLMAANNYAVSLRFVGEFERARALDELNHSQRRKVLGDRHPYTLFSASNFGRDLRDAGEFRRSHQVLDETLRVYREVLGEDNPETLRAAKNLAVTLRKLGEFEQARALSLDSLTRYQRLHGPMHPDTLACEINLACDDSALGDDAGARRHAEDVYARYQRALGETHPFTLACANNLTIFLRKVGDHERGHLIGQQTVDRFRRMLGERHPYTLSAVVNLANSAHALGDVPEARRLDEVNHALMREVRGDDHPDRLAAGSNLAISRRDDGEPESAVALQAEVLERSRRVLGETHPNTLAVAERRRLDCDIELPPT